MRRFRLPILVLGLCLGLGGLWAYTSYAADPTGSNTTAPANTTTGTCTGTGCGTNTSGTTTGTCTGANCGTNTNVATGTKFAGDVVSGASGWWGLRAYTAAIATAGTQPLINIRRASDNHTCDITVAASGGFGNTANCSTGGDNGQTASAFCNATTCSATEVYDQTGTGNHLLQATAAAQPTLTFNCIGTNPCLSTVAASAQELSMAAGTLTVAQPLTIAGVFDRTGNFAASNALLGCNTSQVQLSYSSSASTGFIFSGSATRTFTMSDSALHAVQGVFNGATSSAYVDGVTTSSLDLGNTTGCTSDFSSWMALTVAGGSPTTGNTFEVGIWPVGFTGAQQTAMCKNEQAYLGAGNFGAAC